MTRWLAGLRRPWLPPVVLGLVLGVVTAFTCIVSYESDNATAYDLGFFDQVAEQTAHGHLFASSFTTYSFLGEHWSPIVALASIPDLVAPSPIWLILIQAALLATLPYLTWRVARRITKSDAAALAFAGIAALDPIIARTAVFYFHAEAFTPVFVLLALDALLTGHRPRYVVFTALLFLVKEDALIVAAGLGVVAWLLTRERIALVMAAVSVVGFVVIVSVVMPALRDGVPSDLLARYDYIGGASPSGLLAATVMHPDRWFGHLLSAPAEAGIGIAFLPLLLLPVASGWAILAALPILLISLLSSDSSQAALQLHYGMEAFPLLLLCAMIGWVRVSRIARHNHVVTGLAFAAAIIAYVIAAPLPGGVAYHGVDWQRLDRGKAVAAVLTMISPDASVSASSGLVPHLSNRDDVHEFPTLDRSTYVVLDRTGPVSHQSMDSGYVARRDKLTQLGYHVVAQSGDITLWEHS